LRVARLRLGPATVRKGQVRDQLVHFRPLPSGRKRVGEHVPRLHQPVGVDRVLRFVEAVGDARRGQQGGGARYEQDHV
jgi:hypothetical protein